MRSSEIHRAGLSADPLLTANLYCDHHLDTALVELIAPFVWDRLTGDGEGLWWIRSHRGGAHLKLRIHASREYREHLAADLAQRAAGFFAALPGEPEQRTGLSGAANPAIDPEDEVAADYPDRSLLWTTYRRTPVTLGHSLFLPHDCFAELFATALAAGCADILDRLGQADGQVPYSQRQQILLGLLLVGLGALPFEGTERRAYQTYHRDWLVRFTLWRNGAGARGEPAMQAAQVVEHFDAQAAAMAPAVQHLTRLAAKHWNAVGAAVAVDDGLDREPWGQRLAQLWTWLAELCEDPAYAGIDPYTDKPAQLPLFKVIHGVANAVGLNLLEEALAHHLLLRATESPVSAAS